MGCRPAGSPPGTRSGPSAPPGTGRRAACRCGPGSPGWSSRSRPAGPRTRFSPPQPSSRHRGRGPGGLGSLASLSRLVGDLGQPLEVLADIERAVLDVVLVLARLDPLPFGVELVLLDR